MAMTQVEKDARKLLRDGMKKLKPRGAWIQGNLVEVKPNGQRCYCMLGSFRGNEWTAAYDVASRVLRNTIGGGVAVYNDAPSRRKGQVIKMMQKAHDSIGT